MFDFLLEAFGELLLEALCHLGDVCVQELIRWTKDVF
jgi:hypothetical protein